MYRIDVIMKNKIVGIGVFLLIIGIVILAFALVNLPHTTLDPYQAPWSSVIIDRSFSVPLADSISLGAWGRDLNKGDIVNFQLNVTGGGNKDIDFYVRALSADQGPILLSETRVTTLNKNWTAPSSQTYYFVCDNSFDSRTSKNVTAKITRFYMQTAYNKITEYYPLIPQEFSYVGLILFLAGIGLLIFTFIRVRGASSSSGSSGGKPSSSGGGVNMLMLGCDEIPSDAHYQRLFTMPSAMK